MAKDVGSVFEEDNKTETREFPLLTYHLESELDNYPDIDKAKMVSDFFYDLILFSLIFFCAFVMSLVHQLVCTKIITQIVMERHYLVYCINRIHNRIDILDSIDYKWINTSPEPRHAPIFEKIPIINAAFQKVNKKKFPKFENWSRPFIDVPKQAGPCDCMFFV
jgi:hypothetical protein